MRGNRMAGSFPRSYAEAAMMLGGQGSINLKTCTTLHRLANDSIGLNHEGVEIVRWRNNGQVTITIGNHATPARLSRINGSLPPGMKVVRTIRGGTQFALYRFGQIIDTFCTRVSFNDEPPSPTHVAA